jgi:GNAT superfamily N-acetyltransferase
LGFAQVVPVDLETAELDRIVVFPENTRKGLGTKLLTRALGDQEKKGLKRVIVKAGKDEKHARRFYEKNGFTFVKEETLEAPWGKIELAVYQRSLKQHS